MATRREITRKCAPDYAKASKKAKGLILDELVAVTGWSRARRALSTARKRKGPAKSVVRKPRGRTYGYDTLKVLIGVWRLAGMPSGKYPAATKELWLPKLEAFGELDAQRLTPAVRAQLLKISGATIDRVLQPTRDADRLKGLSATRADPLLRNSITVRKAGDEHEQAPGFIEADIVVHCGPTLAGEFARTLTATDVFTRWTENIAVRNGAHKWVLEAMDEIVVRLPLPMVGLDTDNGGEFINHALIKWAGDQDIYFTRARPYKSNHNAHVEQKNGDVVRRHAFHYRYYDSAAEQKLLNTLYALVRVRLNLFTAATKATGWRSNNHGKKTRIYDKPRTPYQRVIDSGILTGTKAAELAELMETTNPADLTRGITTIQTQLIASRCGENSGPGCLLHASRNR
ncbi:transposase family protein [Arthrobacter sp. UYEF3]|uniref:integrase catalytic domain-containing protein n=1 Tax=Arthrobacter sp. UYEF3 TaxID=1756365 RepID=UPI0033982F79